MSSSEEMMVGLENNPWPHLPRELLSIINKFVSSPIDVTHFRSVCSSWRSSTSLFNSTFPVTTVPIKYSNFYEGTEIYHLTQKIIFRIEPLVQSSSSPTSWLIALEFDGYKSYLVNPFTGSRIETLHSQEMLVVLVSTATLVFYKLGTDRWIELKKIVGMSFKDIILHHGRVYVISENGITFVVYSDFIPKQMATRVLPQFMCPNAYTIESYFIGSCGHIYLIEKYEHKREFDFILPGINHVISRWPGLLDDGVLQIKVHKLLDDEELWEEVSQLDNRVFFFYLAIVIGLFLQHLRTSRVVKEIALSSKSDQV